MIEAHIPPGAEIGLNEVERRSKIALGIHRWLRRGAGPEATELYVLR